MKRLLVLSLGILIALASLHAEKVTLSGGTNKVTVLSSNPTETVLQYRIASFDREPVSIGGRQWFHVYLPKEGILQEKGLPQLPNLNRSVIIDNSDLMKLETFDVEYQDFDLAIAPSKGVITRDIDPGTVPYVFDPAYQRDVFYPRAIAELTEPYILRDFRGITVKTVPFAYNPVTNTLRVYTSYKVRVYAAGSDTVNALSRSRDTISRDFSGIYSNHFINWDSYRYTPVDDGFGKLLVICHTNYMSAILPYVNWKIQKGIPTELVQWSTIGTTAAQLQTYIQNRYNADNDIAYVQLVGDAPQIPSLSSGGGGSDPTFSLVAGSDNYPDIFIGRFSAETTAQVTAQINKAIAYERDVTTSDTWLSRAMGIASAEGGGSQGDSGESDIAHMNNIRTDLLGYGYTPVDQIYDPGASASTVTTNINAGRGFINYVGHGADTYWVTTGFSNTNASALTNGNKTPFIMDVACVNGNFVSLTCFAEAWQRNANGGSVAIYASSINQSWNSPMLAEDEVTDLLIAESKHTVGGLYFNGSCKMMDTYGNTAGSDGVNMFKTWHIFGDASLSSRTKTPLAMSVNHPSNIISGTTSVSVSTGVNNSLVAITYNNVIYGRGFTNSSGNVTITLASPPSGALNYTITATAHNRVTYVGTIAQTVASGPWMEVTAANYDDVNNDLPEYDESGYFDVTFKNSGTSSASSVSTALSCSTPGITVTDGSHSISSLAAGASTNADNAFAISIANNVPNGTLANFTITMTMSGYDPWTHNFSKTINAPALAFGAMTVGDPTGDNDGLLDPGETATISIILNNSGAAATLAGTGSLSCSTTGIAVVNGSASFMAITAGGSATLSFTISAASSMTEGTLAALVFNASAGQYGANTSVNVEVGAPLEVTIGNGTSTQSYPIDRYYNYSSHEAIYLASEIGTAGTIKSIGFYKASGTDVNTIEAVTVYMKNTSSTTLATGTYSIAGYTQVYSGTWPNTATSGWMEVDLATQFEYDGANLSILTIKGNQSYITNYPNWNYTTSAANRARQAHSDTSQPTSLTASTNLPNLKLKLFPAAGQLYPARNLTAAPGNGFVTLNWDAPLSGNPTGYGVYRNGNLLATVTSLSVTDSDVMNETSYSYYVIAAYSDGSSDPSNSVSATPTAIVVTEAIIGSGTTSNTTSTACPINAYYESLHGQSVYTAAELNAAGVTGPIEITQIGFNVTGLPTLAMPNYVVRMGHTAFTNVSSWISSGLSTVWSSASYQPTATGWNMLTLTTPFTWNGTDNIVLDTAFGVLTSWVQSGTTQYTSVNNGYRYVRVDDVDQTNVFTGGSTSVYRPNVKLILLPQASGPTIAVNPAAVSVSAYEGATTTTTVTITNSGSAALNWNTSASFAPWGTVSPTSGTIPAGGNTALTLTLNAGSMAIGAYSSSLSITSNAINQPNLSLPVSFTVQDNPYPVGPRFVAEWEPAVGAIVRYPFGQPYSLLADLSNQSMLYVIVASSSQNACASALSTNGVNMSNVSYINASTDSYWVRDYGPWTIIDANGDMGIVDFEYNRPRPNDNAINAILDNYFGLDYYQTDLVATGGNVMTDGNGKMMSTNLILEENDGNSSTGGGQVSEPTYTEAQIAALVSNYLGIEEYRFYTDPNNTYIDHIDCWAKLLDVDKVIIRSVPTSHAQYDEIEATVDEWEAKTSSYGTPYQIFRVYTPNNEPYTNSFILNTRIYVPQMGTANDAAALTAYRDAMPGYTVTGYTHSNYESTDALHCRVNTIFDEQMVHVWHVPPASATANSTISLEVEVTHYNPMNPSGTYIAYKHGSGGTWLYSPLSYVSGNVWTADVPTPALGQTLYYYILATDNTARTGKLPLCGASDPFELLVDTLPPNTSPTLALPSDFGFPQNGSLEVDFSILVADAETPDSGLILGCSGNTNITVNIDGLNVTFSAATDWFGSETLTFTVSDGELTAEGTVIVNVSLSWLAEPQISIEYIASNQVQVSWNAIPNAVSYEIWSCPEPYGSFTLLGRTTDLVWEDMSQDQEMMFYRVLASDLPLQAK